MDGKRSRFDVGCFDGDDWFAVNRAKYTEEEAIQLCREETGYEPVLPLWEAEVHFGMGEDPNGFEILNCWWLNLNAKGEAPGRCPVWAMEVSGDERSDL